MAKKTPMTTAWAWLKENGDLCRFSTAPTREQLLLKKPWGRGVRPVRVTITTMPMKRLRALLKAPPEEG